VHVAVDERHLGEVDHVGRFNQFARARSF
jgi:hypothetical protein